MERTFDCPRTCPKYGDAWCRFNPILQALGSSKANSHTTKVKVDFKDPAGLQSAVEALGGTWLGQGTHKMYGSQTQTGLGFNLPCWAYPIVLVNGELVYDTYKHSRTGGVTPESQVERLKTEYTLSVAANAAQCQGWMCQRIGDSLQITHPSGGTLTVSANGAEATGFLGQGCHEALMALNLNLTDWVAKPELTQVAAAVQLPG